MKRPKGTKSRRWARSLPYTQRELPNGMHRICCPACHGRTSVLGDVRNRALCSGYSLERPFDRIFIGFHSARSNQRSTVRKNSCQLEPEMRSVDISPMNKDQKWRNEGKMPSLPGPLPPAPSPKGKGETSVVPSQYVRWIHTCPKSASFLDSGGLKKVTCIGAT